jgi:NAD(P)-dependent dehydrogenase (short-subunit alcohol dehydrogenase family)
MGRLDGRVALITGAGGAIGAAISARFAAEGAKLALADIEETHTAELAYAVRAKGGRALFVRVDMADSKSIGDMVATVLTEYGQLDVLVNNAAATRLSASDGNLLSTEPELWEQTLRVNLTGPMLASQHVVRHMQDRGAGGSLVHLSSAAALRGEDSLTSYSVSKAALIALSRQIAVQYGRAGIRSNVVAPGSTLTPVSRALHDADVRQIMTSTSMLGRLGTPQDQAAAALFFASDDAAFVTGTVMAVDGGLTAAQAWVPGFRSLTGR